MATTTARFIPTGFTYEPSATDLRLARIKANTAELRRRCTPEHFESIRQMVVDTKFDLVEVETIQCNELRELDAADQKQDERELRYA